MPTFDFNFDLSNIVSGAISVVVVLVVALILNWVLRRVIRKAITARIPKIREESPNQLAVRTKTLSRAVTQAVSFVIWIVAFLTIASELGINAAPMIAALGLAGLALGFAAQYIIRDYLNGLFILMEDWYRVGEVAIVAGIGGLVVDVNLRRTTLRDLDGTLHFIPNSKIELASNMTRDWARINLDVGVAYGENVDHVFGVINEVGQQLKDDPVFGPDLLTAPQATRVNNLGDSAVEIKIMADTKPMRQWALTGELRKRLKERFDREGIEIPWPHTKVYFGNSRRGNGATPAD